MEEVRSPGGERSGLNIEEEELTDKGLAVICLAIIPFPLPDFRFAGLSRPWWRRIGDTIDYGELA